MITATDLELRAGARILLEPTTLRVQPGDRIGLVGRNGAGKTTSLQVLRRRDAAARRPASTATGPVGYLPQDPRTGDLDVIARDRVLSARGLDDLRRRHRQDPDRAGRDARTTTRCCSATAASRTGSPRSAATRPRARRPGSAPTSACPTACWPSRWARCPVASAAGSSWPASCSPTPRASRPPCCSTSRPTTSTPTRSSGCATSCASTRAAWSLISHDVDAARGGGEQGLVPRRQPLRARRLQRRLEDLPAAARGRREAPPPRAGQRRAQDRVLAQARPTRCGPRRPRPGPRTRWTAGRPRWPPGWTRCASATRSPGCGSPTRRRAARPRSRPRDCPSPTARSRSSPTSTWPSTAAPGWSSSASTAPARRRCCGCWPGVEPPDTGEVIPGHGLRLGYYAQEHETLDHDRTCWRTCARPRRRVGRARSHDTELRKMLGAFLFTGDDVDKPAGVLSGGEKTRLALAMLVTSAANVLLLDEPTNNLDPVSREQVLDALRTYAGAIVLVTHDEGAVEALSPDKVILLPDGVEDTWSADLADLDRRSRSRLPGHCALALVGWQMPHSMFVVPDGGRASVGYQTGVAGALTRGSLRGGQPWPALKRARGSPAPTRSQARRRPEEEVRQGPQHPRTGREQAVPTGSSTACSSSPVPACAAAAAPRARRPDPASVADAEHRTRTDADDRRP